MISKKNKRMLIIVQIIIKNYHFLKIINFIKNSKVKKKFNLKNNN